MIVNGIDFQIRQYSTADQEAVIELWQKCNLTRPWNNPKSDIERKLKVNPELFLVGLVNNKVIASAMGGYEGHRGWVYYLAVDPLCQRKGLGQRIMKVLEDKLIALGCPKINLMIRTDNLSAVPFYNSIGYKTDDVISMGKRLVED
ncbi:MAG TPA: GNAT family acetyltransferase [Dehalococcoidales bacterium]